MDVFMLLQEVLMSHELKHADVLSVGLLVTFADGREALIDGADILTCAEKSNAFEKVKVFQEIEQNASE